VLVATVYNNAFAQEVIAPQNTAPVTLLGNQKLSREQGEHMVGSFFRKTHVFKSLKANMGASDEMIEKFKTYYAADLNKDMSLIFRMVMRGKLNEDNFNELGDSLLAKYSKVYTGFQKLDKSVIDGIEINKNNHKPTSNPLPGASTITPGPIVAACDNIDFESGTLAGWQACWQVNKATSSGFNASGGSCSGTLGAVTVAAYDASTTSNQVSITSGTGVDPVAGTYIPVVCPWGGTHSVLIGDGQGIHAGVGQLKQTFKVTSANANFSYSYAVVIEYPPHVYMNQPYFDINFYDSTGALIPGKANYAVVSQSGLSAGWIKVTDSHGEPAYCKKWSQVFVPLSAYIGHNITVVVEAADCEPTAHFGYAYFDASCSGAIQQSSPQYCGQNVTLTAPSNATYKWSGPCISGSTTTQSVVVTCAGTYSCNVIGGAGDTVHLSTTLATATPITATITPASSTVCKGTSVSLTASGGATHYSWSPTIGLKADTGSIVNAQPASTTTYKVMGSNGSCFDSATATITVNPLPTISITPTGTATICNGASVSLTAGGSSTTYTWAPATGLNVTTGTTVIAKPTTTQTYTLTGTAANGCNATATVVVTVNPTPTVTASASPTAICPGGSATLTASGATTYTWTPNTSLSTTTGASITANPASTITYSVSGTTGTCNSTVQKVTVTVNPTPTVTASANPTAICRGGAATLTGSGATTYLWAPNANLSATTGSSVTASPISTITYSVTGSSAGCNSAVKTVTLTVNPTPTVSASATRTVICPADTTTLSGSGATTYTWAPATGLSATTGTSVIANPTTTQTYTVTGSVASGCNSTATVVVTISPAPVVTASVNPTAICPGGSATLTCSGAATYTWTPNTSLSATTGSSITANPVSTVTYSVTGTNGACNSIPQTVILTVNPTPTVIASANPTAICPGGTATLTGSGATTYQWSPNTNLSATTGSSITASPASTITYSVTGTSAGCNSAVQTVTVTVNSSPTVIVSATKTVICAGDTTTLSGSGATTYTWAPATGLSATTGTSVIANPTTTQTYTLTGSVASGCSATDTVVVMVNPTPVITALASPTSICLGDSSVLTCNGTATYVWTPNTNLSSTTDSVVTAKPANTTTYTVTGLSASGCNSAAQTVVVTVNAYPVITLTGKNATCNGVADTITASGGTVYMWNTGGVNDTIIVHPSSVTTYSVTISNGTCAKDTSIVIGVNSSPAVSVSGHVHHTCGNADTLTAHAVGAGPFAYNWTSGSTDSIAPVMINMTYSVTVTDANSCTTTKSFAVHDSVPVIPICLVTVDSTSTKIIVIWNNPGANSGIDSLFLYRDSVSGPIARLVPGDFSEFVDTTNGMDPNSHYYQYNLDGVDSCGQGSGGLTGYAKTIHLTISPNGCGFILNWTKYSGYFTFTQYYIHRDSANMGWKTVDSVNSGTFTWTDVNCYAAGSNISYYVDVKDNNVCTPSGHSKYTNIVTSRSNSAKGSVITGVQQLIQLNSFSVYPNPFTGTAHLVFGSGGKHYLEVNDVTGRNIESMECNGRQYELSSNGLAKGIYFIRAYDEDMKYVATAKVVVQ